MITIHDTSKPVQERTGYIQDPRNPNAYIVLYPNKTPVYCNPLEGDDKNLKAAELSRLLLDWASVTQ